MTDKNIDELVIEFPVLLNKLVESLNKCPSASAAYDSLGHIRIKNNRCDCLFEVQIRIEEDIDEWHDHDFAMEYGDY